MAEQLFSAITIKYPAAVPLAAWTAVVSIDGQARPADPDNASHEGLVRGITTQAYAAGEIALVQIEGPAVNIAWGWTPGKRLYVGAGGALTETPPATGWIQPVATSDTPTRIFARIGPIEPRYVSHRHIREVFTLAGLDVSNKFILLGQDPATSSLVSLWVEGNGFQPYNTAFVMDGTNAKKLRWDGLSLDGLLQAGDQLVVNYHRE